MLGLKFDFGIVIATVNIFGHNHLNSRPYIANTFQMKALDIVNASSVTELYVFLTIIFDFDKRYFP